MQWNITVLVLCFPPIKDVMVELISSCQWHISLLLVYFFTFKTRKNNRVSPTVSLSPVLYIFSAHCRHELNDVLNK